MSFVDSFNNLDNWIVSNWNAPGGGKFVPGNVAATPSGLVLTLTQTKNADGSWSSVGGEVQCKQKFGYGSYEWVIENPPAKSGQVIGLFNFVNDSETEIDFEIQGNQPGTMWMTNYSGTAHKTYSSTPLNTYARFHTFRFGWQPGVVNYYIDGVLRGTHLTNVPTTQAYPMINFWGTNSTSWGGLATAGTRQLKVTNFQFVP